jgi:hypothetical protein
MFGEFTAIGSIASGDLESIWFLCNRNHLSLPFRSLALSVSGFKNLAALHLRGPARPCNANKTQRLAGWGRSDR